ncbi:hypothetical protein Anas_12964 [Armadillidium nasatum]|uniref:Uncharacterized protein n=1 Tax=Armadillidium nasatum TaxID=96803 RepID=A0A5N5TEG9_9CRUS|nr:hypothetical protein Anas_12964 [Armadillidium nasatum]
MNFNDVSSVPPNIILADCHVIMGGCPMHYKPPPSCVFKACRSGTYCCFDGCSYTCNPIRKDDNVDYD